MNDSMHYDALLDATDLYCPEPVMLLHKKVKGLEVGQVLKVIATDPSTERDIPKFCMFLGHELVNQAIEDNAFFYYYIKIGA